MCDIELDPCEVWRESHPRARKPHVCDSCRAVIAVGEKYLKHFSVFEGDATSEAMCGACEAARRVFAAAEGHALSSPSYFPDLLALCVEDEESATVIVEGEEGGVVWAPMLAALRSRAANPKGKTP